MAFPRRLGLPLGALFLLVLTFGLTIGAPTVARADTLTWTGLWSGPDAPLPIGVADPIPVAAAFNAVSFADPAHGWAVGVRVDSAVTNGGTRSSFIASTTDGGVSWVPQATTALQKLHGVAVAPSTGQVWAVGDAGTLLYRNREGAAWVPITVRDWPLAKALRGIAISGQNGWAVGDGLGVARTTDGGLTWSTVVVPGTGVTLRGVSMVDGASAIAVGDGGVMRSLTGTSSSALSSATGSNLSGVTFADAQHGWAVGDNATFVSITGGGARWTAVPSVEIPIPLGYLASDFKLRSVAFADAANGIAVGTNQGVWRTTDGGAHWDAARITGDRVVGLGTCELTGVGFAAGNADTPVAVGGSYSLRLDSNNDKARVYRATWSRPVPIGPTTRSDARASYVESATIVFKTTVGASGSSVAHTYYLLDGSPQAEGSAVQVTGVGPHKLEFWSVDVADIAETHHVVSFTILLPTATIYTPVAPSTARHARSFTVYGYLKPYHTTGSYAITLYCYRLESSHYVLRRTVRVKVSKYSSYSKYSGAVSLPYTGRWAVRAYHSDSSHRASFSGYDYMRVY